MRILMAMVAVGLLLASMVMSCSAFAQSSYVAPPVPAPAVTPSWQPLTADQLDDLLSPIALYPDPLLAQILPAAAYPDDIADAAAWLKAGNDPDQIDDQPWDPSVQAIARYPDVLNMMANYGDWTIQLGDVFANQQADVMASVQRLRAKAQANGSLVDTAQQNVVVDQNAIAIIPADPQVIYVPVYNPQTVYVRRTALTFGVGFPIGVWLTNDCNWGSGYVVVGGGWRFWRGGRWSPINNRPVYYPGRPGYRPGWDGVPGPWRPAPNRPVYRPSPGRPPMIPNRPGAGKPVPLPSRPGNRLGSNRPGINPPRGQPEAVRPTPKPAPGEDRGRTPAGRPELGRPTAPARPAPGDQTAGEVKKESDRGRQSRTPASSARPAPAPAAKPAPTPAPARAPSSPAARPSSPGGAFGGYESKDATAQESSRGSASRGGGGSSSGGGGSSGGHRR